MIQLEFTEYEARCAVDQLTHRKDDLTQALQTLGHALSERDRCVVRGEIEQITSLCKRFKNALAKSKV
jgi:hypothetical protein